MLPELKNKERIAHLNRYEFVRSKNLRCSNRTVINPAIFLPAPGIITLELAETSTVVVRYVQNPGVHLHFLQ